MDSTQRTLLIGAVVAVSLAFGAIGVGCFLVNRPTTPIKDNNAQLICEKFGGAKRILQEFNSRGQHIKLRSLKVECNDNSQVERSIWSR